MAFLVLFVACSSNDDATPAPMQLGNGAPPGAVGNLPPGGFGNGGSPVPNGAGGAQQTRPLVGAGGIIAGAGGIVGSGGIIGSGGIVGSGGVPAAGGGLGTGGIQGMGGLGSGGQLGSGGTIGAGGSGGEGTGGALGGDPETGRLIGITAAHNAVRASVQTSPPLSPVTWSPTIAAYAQQWADELASTSCSSPHHRSSSDLRAAGYGENLAAFSSTGASSTAQEAVDGWSSEVSCYTLGTIAGTEQCDVACYTKLNSDGCGHYTQIVWRSTTEIGCGVASCKQGAFTTDIWICNYKPPGNVVGQAPY